MRYSKNFERDWTWYLKNRNNFVFSGKNVQSFPYDKNGVDGKKAFFLYDSQGKIVPTRHKTLAERMLKVKASVNFQIKQWAQGRADGTLPAIEFSLEGLDNYLNINWKERDYRALEAATIEVELQLPEWVIKAVEHQKLNYY